MIYRFTITGPPVGKGRPRFVRATGRTFTPKATEDYEATVAVLARAAIRGVLDVVEGEAVPIVVEIVAVFPRPQRLAGKRHPDGRIPATLARTDVDNVAKAVLDGMQRGGVLADDAHVVTLAVTKLYAARGEGPCVEVAAWRTG